MSAWTSVAAGLVALLVACTPARAKEPAQAAPSRPQATLHGVRMRIFRGDELALLGRAARLSFNRTTREVTAAEALLQFRPGSPRPVELRAPEMRGNLDSRGADLSGGVRLRGAGMSGETERAHLDGPSMVASGDQPVKLRGPGYSVRAGGFQLDFEQEAFDFSGEVVTELEGESR